MSEIEKKFLARCGKTLVKGDDEKASVIIKVLKKGIKKGDYISRGGEPENYTFNFDQVY